MSDSDLMKLSSALQNALLVLEHVEQTVAQHVETTFGGDKDDEHHVQLLGAAIQGVRHIANEIDAAVFPRPNGDEIETAQRLLRNAQPAG